MNRYNKRRYTSFYEPRRASGLRGVRLRPMLMFFQRENTFPLTGYVLLRNFDVHRRRLFGNFISSPFHRCREKWHRDSDRDGGARRLRV